MNGVVIEGVTVGAPVVVGKPVLGATEGVIVEVGGGGRVWDL